MKVDQEGNLYGSGPVVSLSRRQASASSSGQSISTNWTEADHKKRSLSARKPTFIESH